MNVIAWTSAIAYIAQPLRLEPSGHSVLGHVTRPRCTAAAIVRPPVAKWKLFGIRRQTDTRNLGAFWRSRAIASIGDKRRHLLSCHPSSWLGRSLPCNICMFTAIHNLAECRNRTPDGFTAVSQLQGNTLRARKLSSRSVVPAHIGPLPC